MTDKKPRYRSYEWRIIEIPVDMSPSRTTQLSPQILDTTSNEDGIWYEEVSQDELFLKRVLITESAILKTIFATILPHLTNIQKETIAVMLKNPDNTQWENVAIIRQKGFTTKQINQGTLIHTLKGHNSIWKNGNKTKKQSGGIRAKIKRYCLNNEQFRTLILKMYNIDETNKYIKITSSFFTSFDDYLDWLYEPIDPLTSLTVVLTNNIKSTIIKSLLNRTHKEPMPNVLNRSNFPDLKQYKYSYVNMVYAAYKDEIEKLINKNA